MFPEGWNESEEKELKVSHLGYVWRRVVFTPLKSSPTLSHWFSPKIISPSLFWTEEFLPIPGDKRMGCHLLFTFHKKCSLLGTSEEKLHEDNSQGHGGQSCNLPTRSLPDWEKSFLVCGFPPWALKFDPPILAMSKGPLPLGHWARAEEGSQLKNDSVDPGCSGWTEPQLSLNYLAKPHVNLFWNLRAPESL